MEFIPLKINTKICRNKKNVEETKPVKLKKNEKIREKPQGKRKQQPQTKIIEKKEGKSKHKERITKKKVGKIQKKIKNKKQGEEEDSEEEDQIRKKEEDFENEDQIKEQIGEEVEDEDEEKGFKKKCQELDEKKKNRLFLKLKKKILSEAQIKELHPDIRSVIFPRKKNSRWCWAVFASEEKAKKAFKKLKKNPDVLVNKPTPHEKVVRKRLEKQETILRKKEARRKLQKMWM